MTKTLLIVSGGIEAADAARRAKEMGCYVVVSDRDPHAPGFAYANSCLIADVYGANETAAAAERYHRKIRHIDGVICVAADAPLTVASVLKRLGLPGLSVESARLASDKLAMKECFARAGVAVPWFAAVDTPQALSRIAIERGRDLVIKPVDSRGSRGVQRVARVKDLGRAFTLAQSHSPTQRVMAEQYLEGPQVSTESIVVNGRCFTPGFSDRNYEYLERYAPFFIENGGDLPSRLAVDTQQKVKDLVARAAAALGIVNGTVKGDIVVHEGEPYVIELAARLSGGFFCTRDSIEHGSRFHRCRHQNRAGRNGMRRRSRTQRGGSGDPALCISRSGPHRARGRRRGGAPGARRDGVDRDGEAGRYHSAGRRQTAVGRHGAGHRCVARSGVGRSQ